MVVLIRVFGHGADCLNVYSRDVSGFLTLALIHPLIIHQTLVRFPRTSLILNPEIYILPVLSNVNRTYTLNGIEIVNRKF